jgi:hypothetical protein
MTTTWQIAAGTDRVALSAGDQGEVPFTVTNTSSAPGRVVFAVIPGEGVAGSWFRVQEPERYLAAGDSASFLVRLAVPAGVAAGSYWFRGQA